MENTKTKEIYNLLEMSKSLAAVRPYKSYELSSEAYKKSKENSLRTEEGYSLVGMAFACRAKSEINQMLDFSLRALEIFEETNDVNGKIKSLNLAGIAYFYSTMYEEALKYFLEVSDLSEQQGNDFMLSCVLNNIGEIYRESSRNDKALEYFFEALRICEKNNFSMNKASILGNIGEIYFKEKKYEESLDYYSRSHDILIEEKDLVILGDTESRLGKIYFTVKDFARAEEYYFSALNKLESVNNKYYTIDVLMNISEMLSDKEDKEAFRYCEKAMSYAEQINAKKKMCMVYRCMSEKYENKGDYKSSLEYYKKFFNINEEITASNLGNKLEILNVELKHIKENERFEKLKNRLEEEISLRNRELEKIRKANETLEKRAYEDYLTGIPNRRCINFCLNNILEEARQNDDTMVVFMIDIDHFKSYNDFWGHSKGDSCLKEVAGCIRNIQKEGRDTFGRYGGEEFVYFAKSLTYEQSLKLGNSIRHEVEKLGLYYISKGQRKAVTISIGGIAGKASFMGSVSAIMDTADRELYKAKEEGRNTTILKYIDVNI
ncbi:MAG: tetratricopeptide repeat-containing diguanylate cyclase [Sedimentibacter sp.]|uniref:tetratricopeptide repeat-containing diguanylate cyclase n=1 Tax=Sedimentibacter sp. TaxID=1960295 RepID=UPI0031586222